MFDASWDAFYSDKEWINTSDLTAFELQTISERMRRAARKYRKVHGPSYSMATTNPACDEFLYIAEVIEAVEEDKGYIEPR